jgi:hypothetical protein
MENTFKVIAPIFLIEGSIKCYKESCKEIVDVVTLAASGQEHSISKLKELDKLNKKLYLKECATEPVLLSYIEYLPDWVIQRIQSKYPQYHKDTSWAYEGSYYMNHCIHCGFKQGDYFLTKPSDGPFNPCTPEEAHRLSLTEIQANGELECLADVILGPMQSIFELRNE